MSVTELASDVYAIQFEHVRVFVLQDRPEGTTTLVDAGFPSDGPELVETLREEFGGIDQLILTHGDEGHFGGTPEVVDAFDPELVVPGGARGFHDAFDIPVDKHVSHGDRLEGGIEVVRVPGHTVSNSGLYLVDDNVFIAGDVLEGSDRRGLPAGYLVPPAEQFNDLSHAQAERNLVTLFDYDIETILVSHGSHVYEQPLEKLNDWLLDREWDLEY
ncbi:MBL fold metallo-hydrolase [Haloarcula brevis]|uniref:MBL fold metallo-hydrolase n=1 Tax=Haloarcula brevis TaxID=3111453 RepID=UPI00300E8F7C